MQRDGRRRDGERRRKGQGETGEKVEKGTNSIGYAGERRQRLRDPNPGNAGYSASVLIFLKKLGIDF
jgi:hypothetical protein